MKKTSDEHKLATKVAGLTADIAEALAANDDYRATRLIESSVRDREVMLGLICKFAKAYQVAMIWGARDDKEQASELMRGFAKWTRTDGVATDEADLIIVRALENEGGAHGYRG